MTFDMRLTSLRASLARNNMHLALSAMAFAEKYHTGRRKDGSHEFSHQVEMAGMILASPHSSEREDVLAVSFLHDVPEDYGVSDQEISSRFGAVISHRVALLDKTRNPFARIATDPISAIVKGYDRRHNLSTMRGAFSDCKQSEYRFETASKVLPMLLYALRRHPRYKTEISHVIAGIDRLLSPASALALA
ncbi:HD domain-containing protein [Loktanella sp. DJP18]|uniref:HD domain-containing protein n=1 Tax=Loktanella sp. DJP18 TaxID=3409788 RepID=UPI003BB7B94A